jgi:hypothetical protein
MARGQKSTPKKNKTAAAAAALDAAVVLSQVDNNTPAEQQAVVDEQSDLASHSCAPEQPPVASASSSVSASVLNKPAYLSHVNLQGSASVHKIFETNAARIIKAAGVARQSHNVVGCVASLEQSILLDVLYQVLVLTYNNGHRTVFRKAVEDVVGSQTDDMRFLFYSKKPFHGGSKKSGTGATKHGEAVEGAADVVDSSVNVDNTDDVPMSVITAF